MKYSKPLMRATELSRECGFPIRYLRGAYRTRGQGFATKLDPSKPNSPIVFDTEKFEQWRQRQIRMQTWGFEVGGST